MLARSRCCARHSSNSSAHQGPVHGHGRGKVLARQHGGAPRQVDLAHQVVARRSMEVLLRLLRDQGSLRQRPSLPPFKTGQRARNRGPRMRARPAPHLGVVGAAEEEALARKHVPADGRLDVGCLAARQRRVRLLVEARSREDDLYDLGARAQAHADSGGGERQPRRAGQLGPRVRKGCRRHQRRHRQHCRVAGGGRGVAKGGHATRCVLTTRGGAPHLSPSAGGPPPTWRCPRSPGRR